MAAKRIAIYPGTFDPITLGHSDLIDRGLKVFDEIIVGVAENTDKRPFFTIDERVDMVKKTIGRRDGVRVEPFEGLVVEYAKLKKACAIVRGVRMISDFEYEFQMALTNRKLNSNIETFFLMPKESYSYLSSRLIREITKYGGDVKSYVHPYVLKCLKEKLENR